MRLNDLFEARRNPDANFDGRLHDRMSSAFGYLSQFKPITGDDPTYFVTFTEIPKVGVNPQSKYQTPIGIYTYPIVPEIVMGHSKKELPFAGDEKFISVVQSTVYGDKILMFDENGQYSNYERDYGKLLQFLEGGYDGQDVVKFLADAGNAAYEPRDPQSRIWNQTRWVAAAEAAMRRWHGGRSLEDVVQLLDNTKEVPGTPINWNYVLRKVLGYDLIIDMGTGTIHQNEPLQALFLTKEALQLVDQRQNQHSAARGPKHVTMLDFYHLLQDGTIGWSTFTNCIDKVLFVSTKRSFFRIDKVQHFIDKPVGEELDVTMKHVARMHLNAQQAGSFKVGLRAWMEKSAFRVSAQTREDLLIQLIRSTVENHSNQLVDPAYEMRSIANDLSKTLEKFTFTSEEVQAALRHLELDQLSDLI